MAVGDTVIDQEGTEFEVVWSGGEGLIPDRATKTSPDTIWEPPPRIYNKTGRHTKQARAQARARGLTNPATEAQDAQETQRPALVLRAGEGNEDL